MQELEKLLSKRVESIISESKFSERIINTINWQVKDFDHNFDKEINKLLSDILGEVVHSMKDDIREIMNQKLKEKLYTKIESAVDQFSFSIPRIDDWN